MPARSAGLFGTIRLVTCKLGLLVVGWKLTITSESVGSIRMKWVERKNVQILRVIFICEICDHFSILVSKYIGTLRQELEPNCFQAEGQRDVSCRVISTLRSTCWENKLSGGNSNANCDYKMDEMVGFFSSYACLEHAHRLKLEKNVPLF